MAHLFFILFSLFQPVQAMCIFPHNPAALCVEGKVTSSKKLSKKSFRCLLRVNVQKLYRPGNVYFFSKELEKIEIKNITNLKMNNINVYSNNNCSSKTIKSILEYNCSDRYFDIPDLGLLDMNTLKGKVFDPWREKSTPIDCVRILSK
jgi:hypothetical protein